MAQRKRRPVRQPELEIDDVIELDDELDEDLDLDFESRALASIDDAFFPMAP